MRSGRSSKSYLTDGASGFETLYEQHFKMPLGPDIVSLVDFWHAAEYLGAAARVLEIKRKPRAGQSRRWRHTLKHDDGAAAKIWVRVLLRGYRRCESDPPGSRVAAPVPGSTHARPNARR